MKKVNVSGVEFEFDEKAILKQEIRVGDNVKLLVKGDYGDPEIYPAVVTDIVPFEDDNPAIEVMYFDRNYGSVEIKHKTVLRDTKGVSIFKVSNEYVPFEKDTCIELLEQEVTKAEEVLNKAKYKLEYFKANYGRYMGEDE